MLIWSRAVFSLWRLAKFGMLAERIQKTIEISSWRERIAKTFWMNARRRSFSMSFGTISSSWISE